ncbi:hypothetical protein ACAW74_18310 [Fibrella sp. WM1]|uniref:hypothetical protein n=1 Tax=Fibrella musci TaxID=3242485 RepID=UPI00351FCAF0
MAPESTTTPNLDLRQEDQLLDYLNGINQAIGRAAQVQPVATPSERLSGPSYQSLIFVNLRDTPDTEIPGSNYALALQEISAKKLAYALLRDAPGFAVQLVEHLAPALAAMPAPTVPRDVIED